MDRIELADGGWISLHNPDDLTEGDRQDIVLAVTETDKTSALRVDFAMTNAIAAALVAEWNIPYLDSPNEVGANPLRQLKPADARLLGPHIRKTNELLFPRPATVDDYEDQSSPTEPASG